MMYNVGRKVSSYGSPCAAVKLPGFVAYFRRRLPTEAERCIELESNLYRDIAINELRTWNIHMFYWTGTEGTRTGPRQWGNPNG